MSSNSSLAGSPSPQSDAPPPTGRGGRRRRAFLAGVLAAAAALGAAELLVVVVNPVSSPVVAVGEEAIRLSPDWLTEFAIDTFGTHDKTALVVGTLLLLALLAGGVGLLARRWLAVGYAGVAAIGLLGAVAAVGSPAGGVIDVLPSLGGIAAGCVALRLMIRPLAAERAPAGAAAPGDAATVGEPELTAYDRRMFLLTSGATAGVAAVAGTGGLLLQRILSVSEERAAVRIPTPTSPAPALAAGADLAKSRGIADLTPLFTANAGFYRIDTAISVPQLDPAEYRLHIGGRVQRPMTLRLADLLRRELIERDITLSCVSNEVGGYLNGTARWIGVPLAALLTEAGPDPDADQVFTTSVDGWTCGTPTATVMDGRDAMLAVAMNGDPLPVEHGFPVRMLVPGLYGYVSATKWITRIELTTFAEDRAYWLRHDWAERAPVKTFSRIDVPRPFTEIPAGSTVIAGIAYATHRGISAVEVRVDDGEWREAGLSPEDKPDMWRQWYLEWDADPGEHTLTVRATDSSGDRQPSKERPPLPDGATGWHRVTVSVT